MVSLVVNLLHQPFVKLVVIPEFIFLNSGILFKLHVFTGAVKGIDYYGNF